MGDAVRRDSARMRADDKLSPGAQGRGSGCDRVNLNVPRTYTCHIDSTCIQPSDTIARPATQENDITVIPSSVLMMYRYSNHE